MAFQQLSADTIATAQQLDYVAFTARYPFTADAYTIGFAPGFRVDAGYQLPDGVDLPVCFLDHDFRNPDRSQLLDAIHTHRPDVAVVGDAYDAQAATELQTLVDDLQTTYLGVEPIIVPKCRKAFDAIDQSTVVGLPNGFSAKTVADIASLHCWRNRPVHILGGSPPDQFEVIQQLTQPTLDGTPPADIRGVDGNNILKAAFKGSAWTQHGWQQDIQFSVRQILRHSLDEIKRFWQMCELWPIETPVTQDSERRTVSERYFRD